MNITIWDRLYYASERIFNRTFGKVLNWNHERLTICGISFMLKSEVAFSYSKVAMDNLRGNMTDVQWAEFRTNIPSTCILPKPDLPNGEYTASQKHKYGITLLFNTIYMFRTC